MQLNMIFARAANGVIGKGNTIPWHLPEDMAHFKKLTLDWPVIMGRKTWDSLPPRFRPLPGRLNIVVTRQAGWQESGALTASNLQQAITLCGYAEKAWVIGGAEIYAQAESLAVRVEVTEINQNFEGDVFAPVLDQQWKEVAREDKVSSSGLKFSFLTYSRATE